MQENRDVNVDSAKVRSLYSPSIGSILRKGGYETYYSGKVHLPLDAVYVKQWNYDVLTPNERDELAKGGVDFLESRKGNHQPFFLKASFINPHDICYDAVKWVEPDGCLTKNIPADLDEALKIPERISKPEFFDNYCPPLPENHQPMTGETSSVEGLITQRPLRPIARQSWTKEDRRTHSWAYMRLTEKVDSLIEKVLNALEASGWAKQTIIIFTSDHGDNNGSHKLEHKSVFYEEAAHIPLLSNGPWAKEPGVVDAVHLVSNGLDLLPTICGFAGIPVPDRRTGKSLAAPVIDLSGVIKSHKRIFLESQKGYLIPTGRYKYELDDMGRVRQMFMDLKIDPGETRTLIAELAYKPVIDSLRRDLLAHLAAMKIPIKKSC